MKVLAALGASVALSVCAAEKTVTWSAAEGLSPDDGTVTLDFDANNRITNMVVQAQTDVVTVSGADALPFAAGAEIRAATREDGAAVFDVPIEGAGTLAFASAFPRYYYENTADYLPEREEDAVVIAHGVDLDDLTPAHVFARAASMGMCMITPGGEYACLYETRGEGTYSCQAQINEGGWAKCVKLCLKQVGSDIVAWTPNAWYALPENYGRDFTSFSPSTQKVSCIATSSNGYGIYKVSLKRREEEGRMRMTLRKAVDGVSTLTVGDGVDVTAEGDKTLTSGTRWETALVLCGAFTLRNRTGLELAGDVTYQDEGEMEILADGDCLYEPATLAMPDLPAKGQRFLIGKGFSPFAITNVTATTAGGWFNEGKKMDAYQFHSTFSNMTCQVQHYDGTTYVKGIVLEFEQEGDDLVAYVVRAAFVNVGSDGADRVGQVDLRTASEQNVYTGGENGYGLRNIQVHLAGHAKERVVGISGKHDGNLSRLRVTGSAKERMQVQIFADKKQAHFTVNTNAVLEFCPPSADGTARFDASAPYFVNAGGEFWHNGDWTLDQMATLFISGGVFRVYHNRAPTTSVQSLYRNKTTFLDGGRISDHGFRMGYYSDVAVTVTGSHPAYIEGGDLGIVGNLDVVQRVITFDVEDVTGDEQPDLYAEGRMYYSNAGSGWTNGVIVKTGAGTVLAGVNEATNFPLTVQGGTWKLGRSGATDLRNALLLEGGTIACAAGCTNAFRLAELAAGTANAVKLDEGAELSFAAFTPGEGSCLSVVTARVSERLRIGTGACLSSAQLRVIRLDGARVCQDDAGYLHPKAPGTLILIR